MEFPEPFHSAKISTWRSLIQDPKVSPYAKSSVLTFLEGRARRRPRANPYHAIEPPAKHIADSRGHRDQQTGYKLFRKTKAAEFRPLDHRISPLRQTAQMPSPFVLISLWQNEYGPTHPSLKGDPLPPST